jgi:hypothetical protein
LAQILRNYDRGILTGDDVRSSLLQAFDDDYLKIVVKISKQKNQMLGLDTVMVLFSSREIFVQG